MIDPSELCALLVTFAQKVERRTIARIRHNDAVAALEQKNIELAAEAIAREVADAVEAHP